MNIMNVEENLWRELSESSDLILNLLTQSGKLREAFDIVDGLLLSYNVDYAFDLTVSSGKPCLIFSPEGDHDAAIEIDSLIARSALPINWIVYGRRQQKNVIDTCAVMRHLFGCDPSKVFFLFDKNFPASSTIVLPNHRKSIHAKTFSDTLLWHLFGEDNVMKHNLYASVIFADQIFDGVLDIHDYRNKVADFFNITLVV